MSVNFTIRIESNDFIRTNICQLNYITKKAFALSHFFAGGSTEKPINDTIEAIDHPRGYLMQHVIAFNRSHDIIGAVFCVPHQRSSCDLLGICKAGWFFTSPDLSMIERVRVCSAMVSLGHKIMKDAGFAKVVTDMGTKAGANFLKRYGYQQDISADNRWVKIL